jgi:predicted transcriptional regulator
MPDEQPTELVAKIVGAYLRNHQVPPDQLGTLISTVHQALGDLGKPAEAAIERTPAVSIRRSVHRDHVICLDCGWKGQMLRRHVTTAHGLTVEGYRARWNLPADHAMTAPGYSERRSTMAKQIGLGRARGASVKAPAPAALQTSVAAPRRRGRPRSAGRRPNQGCRAGSREFWFPGRDKPTPSRSQADERCRSGGPRQLSAS